VEIDLLAQLEWPHAAAIAVACVVQLRAGASPTVSPLGSKRLFAAHYCDCDRHCSRFRMCLSIPQEQQGS
jgi:hypothetical protein